MRVKPMLRPTTKDLAKAAGVSRATVDRVLNARDGVTQSTVDRVNTAIEALGFERNIQAANLAKSQSYRFIFALPRSGDQFLEQIVARITEAKAVFSADHVWCEVHHIDENDPHRIAAYLGTLSKEDTAGVAIMSPETPQVRDAISRLQERGVAALPFISNQSMMNSDWVGIDNRAAGATAGLLLGQCVGQRTGSVMVIAESMQSRDSLERRLGFDQEINDSFQGLRVLPSLETYGSEIRARAVIAACQKSNPDIVGIYVMASEARTPLTMLKDLNVAASIIKVAHERTPFTEQALRERSLDGVIAQDPGHLVRSAIRRLKGIVDRRQTLGSQEQIRIEILLRSNI
jgi:LacI family transcriptional regulator